MESLYNRGSGVSVVVEVFTNVVFDIGGRARSSFCRLFCIVTEYHLIIARKIFWQST